MIDRVAEVGSDVELYEVPVGFKWFADGLFDGSLGFSGEESAGASFLRRDGSVWTTDKDGFVPALAVGRDDGDARAAIPAQALRRAGRRVRNALQRPCRRARHAVRQKKQLSALAPEQLGATELAGETIDQRERARRPATTPGIGGIKVMSARAAGSRPRPSGTEEHLQDLRRKLQGPGPSEADSFRSAGRRRPRHHLVKHTLHQGSTQS